MAGYHDSQVTTGFIGTIPEFIEWLNDHLRYGGVTVEELRVNDRFGATDQTVHTIRMITAGYSDDEYLLGRVAPRNSTASFFGLRFWESTHRGGLDVYEVPAAEFDSPLRRQWLPPASDVFEQVGRARELNVRLDPDTEICLPLPYGARISFSEPNRDINDPAGVLLIEHLPTEDRFDWPVAGNKVQEDDA